MELWDAYREDGTLAGFDLIRGEQIPEGYYHLVCNSVVKHTDGTYLMMRRSFEKEILPGEWEMGAGGSVLKGEDKIQGALREIREETGITEGSLEEIYRFVHGKYRTIYYGFVYTTSCEKDCIKLQEGETIDFKWISQNELIEFWNGLPERSSFKMRIKNYIDSLKKEERMSGYIEQNKKAWEYNAYEFWNKQSGTPAERAKKDVENPIKSLKKYAKYFDTYENIKVANICGSCGKKAIPLALLGAEVTVFDISEDNKRYAPEVADAAKVSINFEVGDVLAIDLEKYGNYFEVVFMEGGILHYFHDIDQFMQIMYSLLKKNGKMICSDFHPYTKIEAGMDYFSTDIFEGEMAHAPFFPDEIRKQMPKCSYRKYTISEIVNATINAGFTIEQFDEHPAWKNEMMPGEFTVIARREY